MKILESYKEKINGTLSFFDRIIINGYLLCLQNPRLFLFYLIQNDIKLTEFSEFSQRMTKQMCDHIEQYTQSLGVKVKYIQNSSISIGDCATEEYSSHPDKQGLIAAFSNVELCRTMSVCPNKESQLLEVTSRLTKCKWYYLYYNDEEFGWMYIKIQTWFPYNVQIYINGREYLSKAFDKAGIRYAMFNNSFSWISDFTAAQEIADKALNTKLSSSFDGIVRKINPHMNNIMEKMKHTYYWCLQECEYATDITFTEGFELSSIFKKLVETTFYSFSCEDVYSFFGRNIKHMWKYNGDIVTDLRNRYQGYRIKFRLKGNQVKMYDKGNSLRIEVTINDPREFKVLREFNESTGEAVTKKWVPMGKSIANLYRYAQISESIIKRLINALPEFELSDINLNDLKNISQPVIAKGRNFSAFNVYDPFTLSLFKAISSGSFLINGFSNKLIRNIIFDGDTDDPVTVSKTTRLLGKLRAHKIIKKVHKANRYYLTDHGRKLCNSLFSYINSSL